MFRSFITALLVTGIAAAQDDSYCSRYPQSQRQADFTRGELERAAKLFATRAGKQPLEHRAAASNNFIDDHIRGKMAADGVPAAPLSGDAEFLRRLYVDLTGRIPPAEKVAEFLADSDANKRLKATNELMQSDAFVDYWTFFYLNLFEVPSRVYNMVGIEGRNNFYSFVRDFVSRDRSWKEVASDIITGFGDNYATGPVNFIVRAWQDGDPIQDTWDTLTDRVTVRFLGIKTECISCHDGRRHLETINSYLAGRKRVEFMQQSAFFSRMVMTAVNIDALDSRRKVIVTDRYAGGYTAVVNSGAPGPRPSRWGGPYEPSYLFTGEKAKGAEWRKELARILTADRQFARAAVNYIWAHFFTTGIVDPPDGWDLARLDPKNPPAMGLQPTHPELIEALADEFIRSNYSIRRVIQLIAESNAYQISSKYEGEWRPEYARYFAKHQPRRMLAEEIYDAMVMATLSETPMYVDGFEKPFLYATQLPDVLEPYSDPTGIRNFLTQFGRGDWWRIPRSSSSTVLQVLYLMNDAFVNNRTFGVRNGVSQQTRVGRLMRANISDEEAVKQLYLGTLSRYPTEAEMTLAFKKKPAAREEWLSNLQWALLQKLDFIFNY